MCACLCVHLCIFAHTHLRVYMCVLAYGVCEEIKKEKPSSKRLQDAMEVEPLFGCLVIFPINHS